jgi:23S rRNA pseudouridine1911/1915/1917 synthase
MELDSKIIYEDDDILAINKPAGLIVHSDGRTVEPSVADWFVKKYPEAAKVGEPIRQSDGSFIERPGIVHRIDRETSGVLLLAKTHKGFEHLKEQFQEREVRKIYNAFVYGILKDDHGSINLPIGKSASDFRKWSASRGARGERREALTYYRVLARGEDTTLIEAQPKTGRTHQIRVHFRALQKPVVGDPLYAEGKPGLLGFQRLALHSRSTTFKNTKGETITLTAPYPEDFRKAMDTVGYPVLD